MSGSERQQASMSLGMWMLVIAVAACCFAFMVAHPNIYFKRRNYELWRVPAELAEWRRLTDPAHPRNPYREISQWYRPVSGKPSRY